MSSVSSRTRRAHWEHGRKGKLLQAVLDEARSEGLSYIKNGEERLYSTRRGIETTYRTACERPEPLQ